MKIPYITKKFRSASLAIIEKANEIIEDYRDQGFMLTLRQLYYQFVARALIDNTQGDYHRLGTIINDGRLAGLIDWDAIEDRTRELKENSHWDSPGELVEACAEQYMIDKWADQRYRFEVWIEKEALAGVIEPTCREFDVPFFSCRGYVSQSEMHKAARRLQRYACANQEIIILHLGDHDPSGIDMTRDIVDRMKLFGACTDVKRIALNMDQVDHYSPPPNPAKMTDSRFDSYMRDFGDSCWELDALEPSVIAELISDEIIALRDHKKWDIACEKEIAGRDWLLHIAEKYEE